MQHLIKEESTSSDAVSEHLTLARQLVGTTAEQLEFAKAQYGKAKATHDAAVALCGVLGGSEAQLISSAQESNLCEDCARIPLKDIFRTWPPPKPQRRRVGDLFQAVERQSWCAFCKFLIEAFQLGDEHQAERLAANLKPRDSAIYFAPDPDGLPWFRKAGLDTDMQPCPFAWLQTGMPTLTGVPHICITLRSKNDLTKSHSGIWPRQREPLEAFNGALSYDLVRSWLEKCQNQHGPVCNGQLKGENVNLDIILIDVSTRQLVKRSTRDKYVALSYVWGKGTELRLRTSGVNQTQAHTESGSSGHSKPIEGTFLPARTPQTMEDALAFVQWLGEQYLWVDLFCIDQNNKDETQAQINIMDTIFSSAFVTLVNLDGDDADWGLPGASRPLLQTSQPSLNTSEGQIMATFIYSVWDNNGTSIWDSRGWTHQERLLSPRCIIFAKNNIAMACRREYFHDCLDSVPEIQVRMGDDYFREDGSDIKLDGEEWDYKVYDALVSTYTRRKLTVEADALNACLGSLNIISQSTGYSFICGVPKDDIWRALIWKPHHHHVLDRRSEFPSWTWLGWRGRTEHAYWVVNMADYADGSSNLEEPAGPPPAKRRRIHRLIEEEWHPEAAKVVHFPFEDATSPHLILSTTTARFKCSFIRRHGAVVKNLKSDSQQSKTAVGDHWALLGKNGHPLQNTTGEHPTFETTNIFFRLNPTDSNLLRKQNDEAEFTFIHQWPKIRDSRESNNWRFDMVSALLIIRNEDNTATRLASVLLDREHWMAHDPIPGTITLI